MLCMRSSASLSSTEKSMSRVMRNGKYSSIPQPVNSVPRLSMISSSSSMKLRPGWLSGTSMKRGRSSGTSTKAYTSSLRPAGRMLTAISIDPEFRIGNGWAESTASGVRTGSTCPRK